MECFQPEGLPDVSQADVGRAPENVPANTNMSLEGFWLLQSVGFVGGAERCITHELKLGSDLAALLGSLEVMMGRVPLAGREGASVACNVVCDRYQTHGYRRAERIMPPSLFQNLHAVWREWPCLLPVYKNLCIHLFWFVLKFFFGYCTGLHKAIFMQVYTIL